MFQLEPLDKWQEVLEQDGLLVLNSSVSQQFVIEKATEEDRVVALVSALDRAGRLVWREKEVGYRIKYQRYTAMLPGSSVWSIGLSPPGEYDGQSRAHHLFLSGGKSSNHLIYNPQRLIQALYYRVYERFGHEVLRMHLPMLDEYHEEKKRMKRIVEGGLAVLEEAIKNG